MAKPKFIKKDKFSDLHEDFKDAVAGSSTDDIRKRVSEIALLECTEKQVLKADPEVAQAKQALKDLMEPYRENLKAYKLQIEYCKLALDEKGGGYAVPRPSPSKGTSQEDFKNKVGDALVKALGADRVERDVTIK